MEDANRAHDHADEHGQDEKDIGVFPAIEFFDYDAGNGKNVIHGGNQCWICGS